MTTFGLKWRFKVEHKITYIYKLVDPREPEHVRYVGKTIDPRKRYLEHIRMAEKRVRICYSSNWVFSLLSENTNPEMIIIEEATFENKKDWYERERYWIAYYKELGHRLTNYTDGGEGGSFSGREHTDEHKKYMSEVLTGRVFSEETRAKMSASAKGRIQSEEARRKNSLKKTGKRLSEDTKRKLSEANKGREVSAETVEKMLDTKRKNGTTGLGRKQSKEHIQKRIEATNKTKIEKYGSLYTDEQSSKAKVTRINNGTTGKGRKQSDEHVQKRMESKSSTLRKKTQASLLIDEFYCEAS